MREFFKQFQTERKAIVFFGALLILVVLGPFGTYQALSLTDRLVYWTVLLIGIGFFMQICMGIALGSLSLGRTPDLLRMLLGAALAAIPGLAILLFVKRVFDLPVAEGTDAFWLWAKITGVGMIYGTVEYLDWRKPAEPPIPRVTEFQKRLEPGIGSDIISLTMRDHYVEVTTTKGTQLILMRLRDAIDELHGLEGLRIHRSHWVALNHVKFTTRLKGRLVAQLSDGRTLPISSSFADRVQAELRRGRLAV